MKNLFIPKDISILNKLRRMRGDLDKNISRFYSSVKANILWNEVKSCIYKNDGFIGKKGQIRGSLSDKSRFDFGYQNHIEDSLNLWFSNGNENESGKLSTGNYLFVGFGSYFGIYHDITIGDNVSIAAQAYIVSGTHIYDRIDIPIQQQGLQGSAISIGNDVWIGCKVVILPGVTIGNGSIVGAGSVVNRNISSFEVWGGVPAKKIKDRK